MSIVLRIDEGDGQHSYFEAAETIVLGRDKRRVHVFLNDDFVSREHATIQRRKDGQWHFIHRGRNASRLDDRFLEKPGEQMVLHDKCIVQVGRFRIQCLIDEEPATEIIASRLIAIESADISSPADDELFNRSEDDSDLDDDSPLLQDTQVAMAIPSLEELNAAESAGFGAGTDGRSRPVQLHSLAPHALAGADHEASLEAPIPSEPVGAADSAATATGGYETLDMSEHILEHQRLMQHQASAEAHGAEASARDASTSDASAREAATSEAAASEAATSEAATTESAAAAPVPGGGPSEVGEGPVSLGLQASSTAGGSAPVGAGRSSGESGDAEALKADQPSEVGTIPLNLRCPPSSQSSPLSVSSPAAPSALSVAQPSSRQGHPTSAGVPGAGAESITRGVASPGSVLPTVAVSTPWYLRPFVAIIAWLKALFRQ